MNRFIKLFSLAVMLLSLTAFSQAQTTTITASHLKISGYPISTGEVFITPVNSSNMAIPFADATGAQNGPQSFACQIVSGAITGAITETGTVSGACSVPDATETTPANILYSFQIIDQSTGLHTSGDAYTIQGVIGVSGATWALDHYGPPASTTNVASLQAAQGTSVPTSCTAPSVFTLLNGSGAFVGFYTCVGGTEVSVGNSGGSMVYPASGIPVSTGTAWATSLTAPSGTIVGTTDTQTLTNKTVDGISPSTLGFVDATSSIQTQLNSKLAVSSFTSAAIQSLLGSGVYEPTSAAALLAPLASPTFTGTPVVPGYETTTAAALLAPLASPTFTGTPVVPGYETTTAAALLAPIASPAFTGSPTSPTQAAGDNTTKVATDAFVIANAPAAPQHVAGAEMFLNMIPANIVSGVIADRSGNGNTATECTGGNAPTSTPTGLYFGGTTTCTNLAAGVNNFRTIEFAINIPTTGSNSGSYSNIMVPSGNGAPPYFFLNNWRGDGANFLGTASLSLWPYGSATNTSTPVFLSAGNHNIIVTFGTNSSTDPNHIYFDGVEVSSYQVQGASAGLITTGNWMLGTNTFGPNATVTFHEVIAYSSELTATQVAQENQAMTADVLAMGGGTSGLQWNAVTPKYIAIGDSLTTCYLTGSTCWVTSMSNPSYVPTFTITNLGNVGKTAEFMMGSTAGYAPQYCAGSSGGPNMAAVFDGTNDFTASGSDSETPAQVAAYIQNQVQILASAGCKVFVGTMISRGGTPYTGASWAADQQALDTIIRQNWKAWGAVGVMDFAADPNLGGSGVNSNITYYQSDLTHLQTAGYQLMTNVAQNAFQYFFGYTKSNPHVITAATYSMTAGDGYTEYSGTSATTYTLPSCVGQSGAEYTINNQTSYTITLKTLNSTQPLDGTDYSTTGLALPAGKNFTLIDVPNALSTTSGCHWSN